MTTTATRRKLEPVPIRNVTFKDAFWAPRVEINRRVTLPTEYRQMKTTGHLDAWTWKPGDPKTPHIFWDSDLAKWIEAAAYSLAVHPDRKLEKQVDAIVDRMAGAQGKDGYLNSHFLFVEPDKRWTNLRDRHELYCAGHLMEAAAAYHEATGKRKFLDIMCRYADLIDRTFGPRKGRRRGYCGHPEIELALIRLFHATGERRYLELSKHFVDERGKQPNYFVREARQRGDRKPFDLVPLVDHLPARKQTEAAGHAVRAGYLYCAMADLSAETGDKGLLKACRRIWRNLTRRRMYIIGGAGSTRFHERFTFDYDLPNEEAYAETCANIALVFFAHRMLQIDPDREYADVIERALYNGVLSGVSLDGSHFFYDNLLAAHPEHHKYSGQKPPVRQEWFGCACCPPNIARLLASLGGYAYSRREGEVWVHLYAQGQARLNVGKQPVVVEQTTRYPWDGQVTITVNPDRPLAFALALRVPGWCRDPRLRVNGKSADLNSITRKGYARIRREWKKGDQVQLTLPMPVERIEAHPSVRHDAGRVALQRGPLVYCLEQVDNGKDLADLGLSREARLSAKFDSRLLGGVVVITGAARRRDTGDWAGQLYRPAGSKMVSVPFKAVPYAFWANRGPGEMVVWVREQ